MISTVLVLAVTACGGARQAAGQYTDDVIRATKTLLGTSSDDAAVRHLDDVARVAGTSNGLDDAALTWSQRVRQMEDDIRALAPADDSAQIREFVIGAACDAVEAAEDGELSDFELTSIIVINQVAANLDDSIDAQAATREVQEGLSDLLSSGDPSPLSRAMVCLIASE